MMNGAVARLSLSNVYNRTAVVDTSAMQPMGIKFMSSGRLRILQFVEMENRKINITREGSHQHKGPSFNIGLAASNSTRQLRTLCNTSAILLIIAASFA